MPDKTTITSPATGEAIHIDAEAAIPMFDVPVTEAMLPHLIARVDLSF